MALNLGHGGSPTQPETGQETGQHGFWKFGNVNPSFSEQSQNLASLFIP